MADCHKVFGAFHDAIRLTNSQRRTLRASRNGLRTKVRAKFKKKGYDIKFHQQGSFAMHTIIASRDSEDIYDIDDGTYILQDDRPQESPATLHRWLMEAAKDHTTLDPSDKGPCVRVFFRAGYHVDLVLYHKRNGDHPKLAHKLGWRDSDPKEFMDWFDEHAVAEPQLRRLVKYFKAWGDNLRGDMPSGLVMTILATNNLHAAGRDDVAFLETMRQMRAALGAGFSCFRPTFPHEDLLGSYSESRRDYFLERLDAFIAAGDLAVSEPTRREACKRWRKHFGDRFQCDHQEAELDDTKVHETPGFIRTDARSAR